MLEPQWLEALQRLWEEGERHDAVALERAHKNLFITPDTGRFLYQLVRSLRPTRVLEVGTSAGYSTLWLALALRDRSASHLKSLDIDPARQAQASANLARFGLAGRVSLLGTDAGPWLAAAQTNSLDFIFLDADRSRYVGYWPHLQRLLVPGGLLVMDNALSHATECAEFVDAVIATKGYLAETYPIGKGQFVIVKD